MTDGRKEKVFGPDKFMSAGEESIKKSAKYKEIEPSIVMDSDGRVKKLFICRAVLWAVALGANIYWIWWSFEIYAREIFDPYEYAALFRPVFSRCILIAVIALIISLFLRRKSDNLKKENAYKRMQEYSMNGSNVKTAEEAGKTAVHN